MISPVEMLGAASDVERNVQSSDIFLFKEPVTFMRIIPTNTAHNINYLFQGQNNESTV